MLILLGQLNGDICMVDMHAVSEHGYFYFHLSLEILGKKTSEFGSASLIVEQNVAGKLRCIDIVSTRCKLISMQRTVYRSEL